MIFSVHYCYHVNSFFKFNHNNVDVLNFFHYIMYLLYYSDLALELLFKAYEFQKKKKKKRSKHCLIFFYSSNVKKSFKTFLRIAKSTYVMNIRLLKCVILPQKSTRKQMYRLHFIKFRSSPYLF